MMVREEDLCYTAFIHSFTKYLLSIGQGQVLSKHWEYSKMEEVPASTGVYIVLEGNREQQMLK